MCGILAHVDLSHAGIDHDRFSKALDLQRHRGPDGRGILQAGNVTLGHRRLKIIDLSNRASQPMSAADGKVIITYNGELYNFLELRKDLQGKGYTFDSDSDTEVLLHLYLEYGIGFLSKTIGMFAFVILDRRSDELFVVRDRLGVKPLYYHISEDCLIFSSEIKSILELKARKSRLNPAAVSSYFSFRYPIQYDTFFDDIHCLEPGSFLNVQGRDVQKKQYWTFNEKLQQQADDKGEEFYRTQLFALLDSSVKYRQIADVAVGAYLSGGVDSSAVVALMASNTPDPVPTFTVGFEESSCNEFLESRVVADRYKTAHHEICLSTTNYLDTMKELIWFKDAPLSVPNEVPLFRMSEQLKQYITVVLSGEGADEIFAGYGRIFRSAWEFEKLKQLSEASDHNPEKIQFLEKIERKYGASQFRDEIEHFFSIYAYTDEKVKKDILTSSYCTQEITDALKSRFRACFGAVPGTSYVNKMMYAFETIHLQGLLNRVDTTTMAASVEARVPFTDHRLVEFAFAVPVKYKLHWESREVPEDNLLVSEEISEKLDTPKYILKEALKPYLDESTLTRKKVGFPVPLDKWLSGEFREYATDLFSRSHGFGVVNLAQAKKLLEDPESRTRHSKALVIWMIVNLLEFIERYQPFLDLEYSHCPEPL